MIDFIRWNIYRPTETDITDLLLPVTMPYITGSLEAISQILQPNNIRVALKPTTMLQHLLINVRQGQTQQQTGSSLKIKML